MSTPRYGFAADVFFQKNTLGAVSIRLYLAINFNFLLRPTLDLVDHLRGFSRIFDLRSLSLFPGSPSHTAIRGGVQLMSCLGRLPTRRLPWLWAFALVLVENGWGVIGIFDFNYDSLSSSCGQVFRDLTHHETHRRRKTILSMSIVRCKKSVRLFYHFSQLLGLLSQRGSPHRNTSISIQDKDHNCYGSKK